MLTLHRRWVWVPQPALLASSAQMQRCPLHWRRWRRCSSSSREAPVRGRPPPMAPTAPTRPGATPQRPRAKMSMVAGAPLQLLLRGCSLAAEPSSRRQPPPAADQDGVRQRLPIADSDGSSSGGRHNASRRQWPCAAAIRKQCVRAAGRHPCGHSSQQHDRWHEAARHAAAGGSHSCQRYLCSHSGEGEQSARCQQASHHQSAPPSSSC